jgi:Ca2+-binding EF-hand superfamily protein
MKLLRRNVLKGDWVMKKILGMIICFLGIGMMFQTVGSKEAFAGGCFSQGEESAAAIMEEAEKLFKQADTNNDKSLSVTEHKDAELEKLGVAFKAFDSDENASISWDEYTSVLKRHHNSSGSDA